MLLVLLAQKVIRETREQLELKEIQVLLVRREYRVKKEIKVILV